MVKRSVRATSRSLSIAGIALAAAATFTVSACSSGQISQTSSQVAAINGASARAGDIAIVNAKLLYPTDEHHADLTFVISNQSSTTTYTLQSITTVSGDTVNLADDDSDTAALKIAPGQALYGPAPAQALASGIKRIPATLTSSSKLQPGLTIKTTFTFDHGLKLTLDVPIDIGDDVSRTQPVLGSGSGIGGEEAHEGDGSEHGGDHPDEASAGHSDGEHE